MDKKNNQKKWDNSFKEQLQSFTYNTAPVDVIVRNVSYYLRGRYQEEEIKSLKFLEIGCGGGVNLIWLAKKGIKVSGVDISEVALKLATKSLSDNNLSYEDLIHTSASNLPFKESSFDGVVESCVLQHIENDERNKAFQEVHRVLKPGGLFIGHVLDEDCTVYQNRECPDASVNFNDNTKPEFYLTNLGYSHFFNKKELVDSLQGFSVIDLSKVTFYLPEEEAKRRGFKEYLQSMWSIYAIK